MLSMSLWKDFQLLQILNDLPMKHLIKLILYENDVNERLVCFSIVNVMLGCLLFKKIKKLNESCSLSKAVGMSSRYLK